MVIRIMAVVGLFLFSFVAFGQDTPAETVKGITGFFSKTTGFFEDTWTFMTVETPSAIQRFFAWVIIWGVKFWIVTQIEIIQFSWGVAKVILEDLALGTNLNAVLSSLPPDLKAFCVQARVLDAVEVLFTAHVTRFVMNIV